MIYLILCRVIELIISGKNTKKLISLGAIELYPFHYKFLVLFHITFIFYFLIKSLNNLIVDINFLYVFIFVQFVRFKVLYDLGKFWTTRIIVHKKKKLIKTGLYKYFKHPNYLVVFLEVLLVSLIFNDIKALLIFCTTNTFLIFIRIYYEEKANADRY